MKPEPAFGSLEWVLRAAGYDRPAAQTPCDAVALAGKHLYVLDLASGETRPRCRCGEAMPEDG